MSDQRILRLTIFPPRLLKRPKAFSVATFLVTRFRNQRMRGLVQTAAIERHPPHRRPEPLPPSDVRADAEHMLLEEQHTSRFEQVAHRCADGVARIGDGAQGEDGDNCVCATHVCARSLCPQCGTNRSDVLDAASKDD